MKVNGSCSPFTFPITYCATGLPCPLIFTRAADASRLGIHGDDLVLDLEKDEAAEDLAQAGEHKRFVMSPAVRVIVRRVILHLVPIAPLDAPEQTGGVQPHLTFRLPEPREPERECEQRAGGGEERFAWDPSTTLK